MERVEGLEGMGLSWVKEGKRRRDVWEREFEGLGISWVTGGREERDSSTLLNG